MSRETRIDCFKKHLDRAIKKTGSGAALAKRLGCTAQTISNWRTRGIDHPTGHSRSILENLAKLLNLSSLDDLFQFTEPDTGTATDRDISLVHLEIIRRFKDILECPEGHALLCEVLDDPTVGPYLLRRILDFRR